MQTKNLSREALLKTMANKHSPKKGSADFGTAEHYYFEIEDKTMETIEQVRAYVEKYSIPITVAQDEILISLSSDKTEVEHFLELPIRETALDFILEEMIEESNYLRNTDAN